MKHFLKPSILPSFTLFAGVLGLALRIWLYLDGIDHKGLVIPGHPANILVFVLFAIVLGVLLIVIRPLQTVAHYQQLFPRSVFPAVGCIIGAVGILLVNLQDLQLRTSGTTVISLLVGIPAAVSLLALAYYRFKKLRPPCWFHMIVTVYLMIHLISQYRLWSAESQLQFYLPSLLASVFLMLTSYHSTVLDARKSGRRWFVFFNQAALFCCCLSLFSDNWPFYAAMGLWMLSGICSVETDFPAETTQEV